MILIENAIVSMEWDKEGFYETKKAGFVAAVHIYNTEKGVCPIIFKDNIAFMLYDEETEAPASREMVQKEMMALIKSGDINYSMEENFADDYIEVSSGIEVDPDVAEIYQLSEEDCKDILNRIKDLSGYYVTTYEDMC